MVCGSTHTAVRPTCTCTIDTIHYSQLHTLLQTCIRHVCFSYNPWTSLQMCQGDLEQIPVHVLLNLCSTSHCHITTASMGTIAIHVLQYTLHRVSYHWLCCTQGPMTVVVQEFDGNFSHTIQVEDISTTHELPCHSKIRKSA